MHFEELHEPHILKCIFGCRDHQDRLSHYLECPILLSILDEVFTVPVPPTTASRVNYEHPSLLKLLLISVSFEIYHAIKIGLRSEVDHAQVNRRFSEIYRVASKVARNFHSTHSTGKYLAVWAAHPRENSEREPHYHTHEAWGSQGDHVDTSAQIGPHFFTFSQGPFICSSPELDCEDSVSQSDVSDDWDLPQAPVLVHCMC